MENEIIFHHYRTLIYPFNLWVAIAKNNHAALNLFRIKDGNINIKETNVEAAHTSPLVQAVKNEQIGVYIIFNPDEGISVPTITHECCHAADALWDFIGESERGVEANAYLTGYFAECCVRAMYAEDLKLEIDKLLTT